MRNQKELVSLRTAAVEWTVAHSQRCADANDRAFGRIDRKLERAARLVGMTKRGYSREFKPHGDSGKRYLLDKIPAGLWTAVQTKAKREGVSIRALILKLLKDWSER